MRVPRYDKSAHGGKGDRVPPALWGVEGGGWDVVVLEGWCVGFMPVGEEVVGGRWGVSRSCGRGSLGRHELGDLMWLDGQLGGYLGLWGRLDALVQMYVQPFFLGGGGFGLYGCVPGEGRGKGYPEQANRLLGEIVTPRTSNTSTTGASSKSTT